jgi:20S proteasome subunit beta 6
MATVGSVDVWSTEDAMVLTAQMSILPRVQLATHRTIQEPRDHRFSPYEANGGTCVGIAGQDFAVLASDTRLSSDYSILSRNDSKATELNDKCVVATGGCRADVITLHKNLQMRAHQYQLAHEEDMSCAAAAQLLSNTLYYKRFFPFHVFNVLAGLDGDGKGAVYTYDSIGSHERTEYAAQGSAQKLIIPVLDSVVGYKNREHDDSPPPPPLTVEEVVRACVRACPPIFFSALGCCR